MFAGAQIITTKLVRANNEKDLIDAQNDDRASKDLVNMSVLLPRSKAAIVVENQAEKIERKALAEERKHERLIEQQKLAQQMEHLMEKVLRETPLSKQDENQLRTKIKSIVDKVNKESDSVDQSNSIKSANQGAFLLWYDKNLN